MNRSESVQLVSETERLRIAEEGMYYPDMEGDACGTGLIAEVSGKPSRRVVTSAIEALRAVWHRGAVDAAVAPTPQHCGTGSHDRRLQLL